MSYYSTPVQVRESQYIEVHGDPRRPKRKKGIGDLVEYVARRTGIKSIVNRRAAKTGKPCGCQKRKDQLNNFTDKYLRRH